MYEKIINATNGRTEDGLPKCAVSIDKYIYDVHTKEPTSVLSRPITNSCVTVSKIPSFDRCCIQIDFSFLDAVNYEMSTLWDIVQEYYSQASEVNESSVEIPQIYFTIVPLELECQYYIMASLPIFCGLAVKNLGDEAKTIRLVFDAESVQIYETNSVDYEKIVSIVNQEILNEEKEEEERIKNNETQIEETRAKMYSQSEKNKSNFDDNNGDIIDDQPDENEGKRFRVIE